MPPSTHPPRFLLLYGSLRERSYSRFLTLEAARLLEALGGDVRVFDPTGLPLPDSVPSDHPKVVELRQLAAWSEGMVWCSPERHGTMTGIFEAQIDWIPLEVGSVRPTQGKTLAVMEVSGGSQSFNAVNQLRILGRWMRMITIPNQSSVVVPARERTVRTRTPATTASWCRPASDRAVDPVRGCRRTTAARTALRESWPSAPCWR